MEYLRDPKPYLKNLSMLGVIHTLQEMQKKSQNTPPKHPPSVEPWFLMLHEKSTPDTTLYPKHTTGKATHTHSLVKKQAHKHTA